MPGKGSIEKVQKKEHFNLVILEKHGRHFELDVNPDKAIDYKEGKIIDLKEVVMSWHIFADIKKGLLASKEALTAVFDGKSIDEIIGEILKTGDLQLTSEHRQKIRDAKYSKIINDIHRMAIDTRTMSPIPITRIKNGLEETKFKVKDNESFDKLFKNAIKGLKTVIPLRITNLQYEIYFDVKYADELLRIISDMGQILKKEFMQDKMHVICEISSGLKEELLEHINNITKGTSKVDLIKT